MSLDLRVRHVGQVAVVELHGDLDSRTALGLPGRLDALLPTGGAAVLDLTCLPYLSSGGLRGLLLAHRLAEQRLTRVVLAGLAAGPRSVLAVAGFMAFLDVAESVGDGLARLCVPDPDTAVEEPL